MAQPRSSYPAYPPDTDPELQLFLEAIRQKLEAIDTDIGDHDHSAANIISGILVLDRGGTGAASGDFVNLEFVHYDSGAGKLEASGYNSGSFSASGHAHAHTALTDVTTDQHHAQGHTFIGGDHTISGLTTGHFLKATGSGTYAFQAHGLEHDMLAGLNDDDHSQYHTDARGDARYSLLGHHHDADYALIGHDHDSDYLQLSGGVMTGPLELSASAPTFRLSETDAPADEGKWEINVVSGDLKLWTRTDAGSNTRIAMEFIRSGSDVSYVNFPWNLRSAGSAVEVQGHDHDSEYYTQGQLDGGQLNSLYYTEGEVNTLFTNHASSSDHDELYADLTHNLIDTTGHPVSGLDAGDFLKALTPTTYGFAPHGLDYSDVGAAPSGHTTSADHDSRYYTEDELNGGQLNTLYYTETEVNNNFSDIGHNHSGDYLPIGGGTLTGPLTVDSYVAITDGTQAYLAVQKTGVGALSWGLTANNNYGDLWDWTNTKIIARYTPSAGFALYYNSAQKFITTTTGASLTGTLTASVDLKVGATSVSLAGHSHNDLYYTEGECDTLFAAESHDHDEAYADITHPLIETTNHYVSGLSPGHFLKALTDTTYGFAAHGLTAASVGALAAGGTAVDSDKVDGEHAAAFANATHAHSAADITSGELGVAYGGLGESSFSTDFLIRYNGVEFVSWVDKDTISLTSHNHSGTYLPLSGGTLVGTLTARTVNLQGYVLQMSSTAATLQYDASAGGSAYQGIEMNTGDAVTNAPLACVVIDNGAASGDYPYGTLWCQY